MSPLGASVSARSPSCLAEYIITGVLGSGGNGVVLEGVLNTVPTRSPSAAEQVTCGKEVHENRFAIKCSTPGDESSAAVLEEEYRIMKRLLPDQVSFPQRRFVAPIPYDIGSVSAEAYHQCLGNPHVCHMGTIAKEAEVVYVVMSSCGPNSTMDAVLNATRGVHGMNFEAIGVTSSNSAVPPWYKGTLTIDLWLTYCTEMLELVRCLHSQKIVHGDIKLSNFCAMPRGPAEPIHLIMIDFGFANALVRPRAHLPRQQHFKGTPDYASVRMLLCEPTLYIDDLEALVYCFMELLCGDLPWRFDRDVATAKPVEFEIFAKQREKLWAKYSQHIPKPIFELLLVVMREATQQRTAMNIECSSSVYKHLDMTLKSARDAMEYELQHMQKTELVNEVFGDINQPVCLVNGVPGCSDGGTAEEEARDGATESDECPVEDQSRKRTAETGYMKRTCLKKTRLALPDAHKAEQ